jgi:hypothetical protein
MKFLNELVPFFVVEELQTLFSRLIELVTLAEPLADLWKSSVEDVLLDEVTMCSGNWKDVYTPFAEQWNSSRVQKSIRHLRSTAGVLDAYAGIPAETNVAPTI